MRTHVATVSRLIIVTRSAALLSLSIGLAACAGVSTLAVPVPARLASEAYRERMGAIVSSWEAVGGSRTDRPRGWDDGLPAGAAVSAAWWGFYEGDATDSLQKAMDSGAPTVVVPKMPTPWIVSHTLSLRRSGVELCLEPGVVILAAQGAFRGGGEGLIEANGPADFSILGYGAALRMRKSDYQKAPYEPAEWRHAISVRGVSRVLIAGLRIESSGGDGIYVGTLRDGDVHVPCEDIVLRDLEILDNHRQGVSIISARRLLIENCLIAGTSGTLPQSGIDFEPNSNDPGFKDCVVRDCRIERNAGVGLLFLLSNLGARSEPISIHVQGCIIDNFPISVWLHGADNHVRGTLSFAGNSFRGLRILNGTPDLSVALSSAP